MRTIASPARMRIIAKLKPACVSIVTIVISLLLFVRCPNSDNGNSGSAGGSGGSGNSNTSPVVVGGATNTALNLTGVVTTFAGSTAGTNDGTGTGAQFNSVTGLTSDGTNLYAVDGNRIRKIVIATGVVTTLAGTTTAGSTDATGTSASFNAPFGLTTDGTYLYIADAFNYKIRRLTISTGVVTTFAGGTQGYLDATGATAQFDRPYGIFSDNTNLYVTDTWNNKIRKIVISSTAVTTLAGAGPGNVDGTGTGATFNTPRSLTADTSGNLIIGDYANCRIRKLNITSTVVSLIAGTTVGAYADGTGSAASFSNPQGITSDGTYAYVADSSNNRIRKVHISTGVVTTLAGSGTATNVDGTGAGASFSGPTGITTDGKSLFVGAGVQIRKID